MNHKHSRHQGLILLIVLGMLSLFSLLAISFMVITSQSRRSNAGRAGRDFRGTAPEKLLDDAIRPVLRGTTDPSSALFQHDLLGDIYGNRHRTNPSDVTLGESFTVRVRRYQFGVALNGTTQPGYRPLHTGSNERPVLINDRFLRIPIVPNAEPAINEQPIRDGRLSATVPFDPRLDLPRENDALTSRVATFLQGPLQGQSFPIVRYVGDPIYNGATAPPALQTSPELENCFSITIDLQDAVPGLNTVGSTTRSLAEWIRPTGTRTPRDGLQLCYPEVAIRSDHFGLQPTQPANPIPGYQILINGAPFSSHGKGISGELNNMYNVVDTPDAISVPSLPAASEINNVSQALQPFSPNRAGHVGDANESYDAADYLNVWLSHRKAGASSSADIIPSFHRAALINYLVNWKDPSTYTLPELIATCQRLIRATGRPLSIRITDGANPPNIYFASNPDFSGGSSSVGASQLDCVFRGQTDWTGGDYLPFVEWAQWLCIGPWDVDSDSDGLYDGIWVDPNLPLTTSREGKLLKVLVSYTIESLDSRLDLAATGNLKQLATWIAPTNNEFASNNIFVPQGTGWGSADTSLRHLFESDASYRSFLQSRYGADNFPGHAGNDPASGLHEIGRRDRHDPFALPGLPNSEYGWTSLGFDLLGNPRLSSIPPTSPLAVGDQSFNDPYESRVLSGSPADAPMTISEWENMLRNLDWDRSSIAGRIPGLNTTTAAQALASLRSITPRSRHFRYPESAVPRIGGLSTPNAETSAFAALREIYRFRYNMDLSLQAMQELFPLEAARGQKLSVNRPLGNGYDDDVDGNVDEPNEEAGSVAFKQRPVVYDRSSQSLVLSTTAFDSYLPSWVMPPRDGENPAGFGVSYGGFDPTFEGLTDATIASQHFGQQSRQLLARNLYSLAMLILPQDLSVIPKSQLGTPLRGDARARVIAQWAVNVVDFRDADSAMTRFPYDPTPFTKTAAEPYYWQPTAVVWGREQQELILTESLATHDLRVRDTSDDDNTGSLLQDPNVPDPNATDETLDQYRIPEPSLFLELMCLRTTQASPTQFPQGRSPSLYDAATGELDLTRMTRAVLPGGPRFPVFRIAISTPHPANPGMPNPNSPLGIQNNPVARASAAYQFSTSPSTSGLSYSTDPMSGLTPPTIDRVVLFQDDSAISINKTTIPDLPSVLTDDQVVGRVFTRTPSNSASPLNNRPTLAGGEYLVVGPRELTFFGSTTASSSHIRNPNPHRIFLDGSTTVENGWVSVSDSSNNLVVDRPSRPALARNTKLMIAQQPAYEFDAMTSSLTSWGVAGLNVSAPYGLISSTSDGYYPRPTNNVNSNDNQAMGLGAPGFAGLPEDGYRDFGNSIGSLPDLPFDGEMDSRYPLGDGNGWLQHQDGIPVPGTAENWCTAFLQRLADPERPWHADFNPYITIDWIPIDLTVFSGEEDVSVGGSFQFATRQKSGAMVDQTSTGPFEELPTSNDRSFYSYGTTELPAASAPAAGGANAYFAAELPAESVSNFRPTTSNRTDPDPTLNEREHFATLGYLNSSFGLHGESGGTATADIVPGFVGVPYPMPAGLFWADRPFSNPLELSLVPFSAPGQLGQEFFVPSTTVGNNDSYTNAQSPARFTHLLNFFQQADVTGGATSPREVAAATLFDLVETSSAWADSEEFVPPENVSPAFATHPAELNAANYVLRPFGAPYNKISQFVEPGRVNVNDLSEPAVLQGLLWNQADPTGAGRVTPLARPQRPLPTEAPNPWTGEPAALTNLQNSRAGYDITAPAAGFLQLPPQLEIDSRVPTQFGGVFKSASSAGFVPRTRDNSLDASVFTQVTPPTQPQRVAPVNATLLRQELQTGGNDQLFSADYTPYSATALTTRHAYYDYLPFTRLSNLVTTRSNVFSVRVTVGFFEYNSATGLGREYGIDEGTAQRHKAFYVIDRSIPVGYQEGLDLNTDQCILMRRIIE